MTNEEYMEKKALQDQAEVFREGIREALKCRTVEEARYLLRALVGEEE